jgi:hypothetical protein
MMETNLSKMDDLLAVLLLGQVSEENRLTQEHIQGARTYLLGGMPREYRLNLEMARDSASQIPDQNTRERAERILESVM